ncbi:uncharacterized protein CLUP02_05659 [Colletotrichum lupini]|uniref:Uncharacterized protein n=1 Tax=Colletotrichum lupini TaxID=145971 RepID=A0A9Q8SPG6_9PEZI|nr:uncharacterized protein CLUP02_05659 [Colletotrichum lupini]UQC80177.1 hypothetical protein CLUP02_05659 [Colletotrichum lupini]
MALDRNSNFPLEISLCSGRGVPSRSLSLRYLTSAHDHLGCLTATFDRPPRGFPGKVTLCASRQSFPLPSSFSHTSLQILLSFCCSSDLLVKGNRSSRLLHLIYGGLLSLSFLTTSRGAYSSDNPADCVLCRFAPFSFRLISLAIPEALKSHSLSKPYEYRYSASLAATLGFIYPQHVSRKRPPLSYSLPSTWDNPSPSNKTKTPNLLATDRLFFGVILFSAILRRKPLGFLLVCRYHSLQRPLPPVHQPTHARGRTLCPPIGSDDRRRLAFIYRQYSGTTHFGSYPLRLSRLDFFVHAYHLLSFAILTSSEIVLCESGRPLHLHDDVLLYHEAARLIPQRSADHRSSRLNDETSSP